jgi:hypothetical protein
MLLVKSQDISTHLRSFFVNLVGLSLFPSLVEHYQDVHDELLGDFGKFD